MAKIAVLAFIFAAQLFAADAQTLLGGASSIASVFLNIATRSPVPFTYASVGSGTGRRNFNSGTFLVASSDNAHTPAEDAAYTAARGLPAPTPANAGHFTLPYLVLGFGVFVSTNANLGTSPGMRTPLSLSAADLAKIYNDQACNWGQVIPGRTANLIYFVRCDSSGTTKVFTTYLQNEGGFGSSFSAWPGLPACTTNPPASAVYRTCGQPSISNYFMAVSLSTCVSSGCITYIQAGYGKGKGAGPGETPIRLAEIAIPNKSGTRLTSSNCLISQALPSISPTTRQSWFSYDNALLSAAGSRTCPLVALNYLNARFTYPAGSTAPRRLLVYLFGPGYSSAFFINQATTPLPASLKTKSTVSAALVKP